MLCMSVCGVLLGCAGLTLGTSIPYYNLSVTNQNDATKQWLVEIKIDHEDGQPWNMLFTHSKNSSTAKFSPLNTEDDKVTGPKKCPPPGYEQMFGKGYYTVHGKEEKKTWQEAENLCESEGGHLIVIDSQEELLLMNNMAFKHAKEGLHFFVGVHDQYKEGDYVTISNNTMKSTRYSTWYPGEPNGGTGENCVYFYYDLNTHRSGLVDIPCKNLYCFICEIETL